MLLAHDPGARMSRASMPSSPGLAAQASPSSPPDAGRATRASIPPGAQVAPNLSRPLDKLLAQSVKLKASDVHVHTGAPMQLRVNGKLFADKSPPIDAAKAEAIIFEVLAPEQRQRLLDTNDIDFVYAIPGIGRFRANVYRELRGWDAVFRFIPPEPPTLDELGLSRTLAPITRIQSGLVLLTGPAGCGKSSTMAALIDHLNNDRAGHVITIEDPIEFVHRSRKSLLTQREINRHTESFAGALRAALRQHPDIIAIGELRDLETIALAVTAAETGHLVLGTLHTNNAVRSINRMLDVFPPKQQPQIRAMLSDSIRAVVSQRLLPAADGNRRVPVVELLLATHAVSNMIREEKTHQIRSVLQTGGRSIGMVAMDDALAELVKLGTISKEVARRHCEDPKVLG
jgi:twitching motility protein PilT